MTPLFTINPNAYLRAPRTDFSRVDHACAVIVYTDNSLAARIARLVRRVLG